MAHQDMEAIRSGSGVARGGILGGHVGLAAQGQQQAQDVQPLDRAITQLSKDQQELDEALNVLVKRLHPVLTPEGPETAAGNAAQPAQPLRSPVMDRLELVHDHICDTARFVRRLVQRLET